jgi:hypothetical protein
VARITQDLGHFCGPADILCSVQSGKAEIPIETRAQSVAIEEYH